MLSLPNFRLARALSFILWRGGPIIRPALGMAPALMVRAIAGAAGGSVFRFFLGGAGELRGHRGNARVSTTGVDVSAIDSVRFISGRSPPKSPANASTGADCGSVDTRCWRCRPPRSPPMSPAIRHANSVGAIPAPDQFLARRQGIKTAIWGAEIRERTHDGDPLRRIDRPPAITMTP